MKYIDAEKLLAEIERLREEYNNSIQVKVSMRKLETKDFIRMGIVEVLNKVLLCAYDSIIQQVQPEGNLEYWLEHFGMPKENIDNCITQIAQGYGACRYLEGIQHGAEAVNELAKQKQPSLPSNLDEAANNYGIDIRLGYPRVMDETDRYIYNAFRAGAEWMAGQGATKEAVIGMATEEISINVSQQTLDKLDLCPGEKVVVQIRKK